MSAMIIMVIAAHRTNSIIGASLSEPQIDRDNEEQACVVVAVGATECATVV